MQNKPSYAIESVDNALHLATLLQHEGPLRVTDAAERLGVSASTAHRLLAMLVYRDFAEQGSDRRYRAGSVLRASGVTETPAAMVRRVAMPHLEALVERTHESANVMVVAGTEARFVATVECDQILRVGDRAGRLLPAHLSSGGKAVLATRSPRALEELYAENPDVDLARLRRELSLVRKRGFAINDQATETGLTALGMLVDDLSGEPSVAISLAMPTARFHRDGLRGWVLQMQVAASAIAEALAVD